jgi:hypothetical protein
MVRLASSASRESTEKVPLAGMEASRMGENSGDDLQMDISVDRDESSTAEHSIKESALTLMTPASPSRARPTSTTTPLLSRDPSLTPPTMTHRAEIQAAARATALASQQVPPLKLLVLTSGRTSPSTPAYRDPSHSQTTPTPHGQNSREHTRYTDRSTTTTSAVTTTTETQTLHTQSLALKARVCQTYTEGTAIVSKM